MFCPECGKENEDSAAFCEECGSPLNFDQQETQVLETVKATDDAIPETPIVPLRNVVTEEMNPQTPNVVAEKTNPQPTSEASSGSKSKAIPIVVISCVVIAIIVALVMAFFLGSMNEASEENSQVVDASEQEETEVVNSSVISNSEPSDHTVAFETMGGTTYETLHIKAGNVITSPVDPTRAGYTFEGWYLDSTFTQPVYFPYTVKQDDPATIIFYAKWKDSAELNRYDHYDSGIFPQSSTAYLTESDLYGLSKEEIQRAINEIYARNGYIFQTSETEKRYFESQPWYHGTETDMGIVKNGFNSYEAANEKLLTEYRAKM